MLLEQKGYPDEQVAFQLLKYIVRIWEKFQREKRGKFLPILPLVLYYGQKKWKFSRNFADLVAENEIFAEFTPHFNYHLRDLSAFDQNEIKGAAFVRLAIHGLRYIFSKDLLFKLNEIVTIIKNAQEQSTIEFLGIFFRYISAASDKITEEDLRQIIRKAFPKWENKIMPTLARKWFEEGSQEGLKQGLQQGFWEGPIRPVIQLLEKKFGKVNQKTVERIQKLSNNKLETLSLATSDFRKKSEVAKWLDKFEFDNEKIN